LPELLPVRAWLPNPAIVEPTDVIAPVYDTLTEADFARFGPKPYNAAGFVARPPEVAPEEFIEQASKKLDTACRIGAFIQDASPSLYVYGIRYSPPTDIEETIASELRKQYYLLLGLVGAIDLSTSGADDIAPHERTFPDRVEERIRLTDRTRMHFAPILAGYTMKDHAINDLLERFLGIDRRAIRFESKVPPAVEAELEGTVHRIWRIDDPRLISELQRLIGARRLLILDGHHRFAAAMARHRLGQPSRPLVMVVEYGDRALLLRPWHRVIQPSPLPWPSLRTRLGEAFDEVTEEPGRPDTDALVRLASRPLPTDRRGFVVIGPDAALRVSRKVREPSEDHFDVLHSFLEGDLRLDPEHLRFVRSPRQAIESIGPAGSQTPAGLAILMPPLTADEIDSRAFTVHLPMAQKSTMFLPKVAEGMMFAPAE
jgi:uncharacterized protein (DUF1015 family)